MIVILVVGMIRLNFIVVHVDATERALAKLPFNDDVLNNSKFINFEKRAECTFNSVEFFCDRYSNNGSSARGVCSLSAA